MDKSHLGRAIPVMILGFGGPNPLGVNLLKIIMSSRKELSSEKKVYYPVLGIGGKTKP
jgi:hypothetical protein